MEIEWYKNGLIHVLPWITPATVPRFPFYTCGWSGMALVKQVALVWGSGGRSYFRLEVPNKSIDSGTFTTLVIIIHTGAVRRPFVINRFTATQHAPSVGIPRSWVDQSPDRIIVAQLWLHLVILSVGDTRFLRLCGNLGKKGQSTIDFKPQLTLQVRVIYHICLCFRIGFHERTQRGCMLPAQYGVRGNQGVDVDEKAFLYLTGKSFTVLCTLSLSISMYMMC